MLRHGIAVLLAGAGAGGYLYYASVQKKRLAAQRLAQKKAAQQRREQASVNGAANGPRPAGQQAPNAQQAARIRTGTAAGSSGTMVSKPAARTSGGTGSTTGKPYSRTVENPYGRYTTGSEEDSSYTASFKPGENRKPSTTHRRRNGGSGDGESQT